jgi:DNA-directed RNA polymerase specialized sigma24 family protein
MPGRYVTDAIYDRLRSIGVSVETADALAPVVAGLSPRKREAFFLWAMGLEEPEISKLCGMSRTWAYKSLDKIIKSVVQSVYENT